MLRIGLVVGEISGDNLGASLIRALRAYWPDLVVEGIVGPELLAEGCHSLGSMETLAVMGYWEPLKRLPELFKLRRSLIEHFTHNPPDIFIGIDAPDFNLGLEEKLHALGIPVVHYVSPSVWAWKQYRLKTIKKAVDLMLCLFPFEEKYFVDKDIPVQFVGHPLADEIPLSIDSDSARNLLGYLPNQRVVALLPGSRDSELKYLGPIYLKTALALSERESDLQFIVPLVSQEHKAQFLAWQKEIAPLLPVKVVVGSTRTALSAADIVLVTSGTATLEVMLHKKPMVVAYKMHPLTYAIARRLVKVPFIALPNLLAGKLLVPEFIQDRATPEVLTHALLSMLNMKREKEKMLEEFQAIHLSLKQNASEKAASAIKKLLE